MNVDNSGESHSDQNVPDMRQLLAALLESSQKTNALLAEQNKLLQNIQFHNNLRLNQSTLELWRKIIPEISQELCAKHLKLAQSIEQLTELERPLRFLGRLVSSYIPYSATEAKKEFESLSNQKNQIEIFITLFHQNCTAIATQTLPQCQNPADEEKAAIGIKILYENAIQLAPLVKNNFDLICVAFATITKKIDARIKTLSPKNPDERGHDFYDEPSKSSKSASDFEDPDTEVIRTAHAFPVEQLPLTPQFEARTSPQTPLTGPVDPAMEDSTDLEQPTETRHNQHPNS